MDTDVDPLALPDGTALAEPLGTDFFDLDSLLTDRERELRDWVRATLFERITGIAPGYWDTAQMSQEMVDVYASLGIAGAAIDGYGCAGVSPLAEGFLIAELARADGSLATLNAVHSGLAMTIVNLLGSDDQRDAWLAPMARCEKFGCVGLTEPNHGSDVVRMETRAIRDGDEWVITGAKRWIGLATMAEYAFIWAREEDGDVGCFMIEAPNGPDGQSPVPGWDAQVIGPKMSNRGVWQAHIRLDGVRTPAVNRVAQATSFAAANKVLNSSRQGVAWEALGHAVAAYEGALTYALRRTQFGRPIAMFQLVQDKLSQMAADVASMQLMCTRMSQLHAEGRCTLPHAAMTKMQCARLGRRVCAAARDILGGNGILLDHHVGRHFADMEAVYTYEGSDTVQSLIVGRELTGLSAFV